MGSVGGGERGEEGVGGAGCGTPIAIIILMCLAGVYSCVRVFPLLTFALLWAGTFGDR